MRTFKLIHRPPTVCASLSVTVVPLVLGLPSADPFSAGASPSSLASVDLHGDVSKQSRRGSAQRKWKKLPIRRQMFAGMFVATCTVYTRYCVFSRTY